MRIHILEQIMQGLHSIRDISHALHELGYSHPGERNSSPYQGNNEYSDIHDLIVQESLRYEVPSSQTALIAQGKKEGKSIKATIFIPSAPSLSDSLLLCDSIPIENVEMCSMKEFSPDLEFYDYNLSSPKMQKHRKKPDIIKCEAPRYPPVGIQKKALSLPILRSVSPPSVQGTEKTHEIRINKTPDNDGIIYNEIAESSFSIQAIIGISIPPEGEIGIFIGEDTFPRVVVTTQELIKDGIYAVHIDVKKGERVKVYARTLKPEKMSIVLQFED